MAGTLRNLVVATDDKGRDSFALRAPSYVNSRALAAGVAETIAAPNGARYVLLACTADFYVNWQGQTAAVPGDIADGSAPELNPAMRYIGQLEGVAALGSFSVISPEASVVTASFFS
jgi:hypothetical protein